MIEHQIVITYAIKFVVKRLRVQQKLVEKIININRRAPSRVIKLTEYPRWRLVNASRAIR